MINTKEANRMKKFLSITALSLLAFATTLSATPVEDTNIEGLDAVTATYIIEDKDDLYALLEIEEGELTVILADEAIVREQPSPDSDILNFIAQDSVVYVTERIDNYYKIQRGNISGYIYREQLDEAGLEELPYTNTNEVAAAASATYLGEEIVAFAKQFLGNPYVYGGNSLYTGVDCSGFVQQVMKNFGISVQRSSRSQYASNGYKVSQADLLPGDLVFYGYNGYIDHVAIYAGDGQIIHASTPKTGICMSKLNYGKPIIGMKRII